MSEDGRVRPRKRKRSGLGSQSIRGFVKKDLQVTAGATRLFEESDSLEEVSLPAREWFVRYLESATRQETRGRAPSAEAPQ